MDACRRRGFRTRVGHASLGTEVATLLEGRGISVKRYRKPTVARTAPKEIEKAIVEEVDVVVEGLAD